MAWFFLAFVSLACLSPPLGTKLVSVAFSTAELLSLPAVEESLVASFPLVQFKICLDLLRSLVTVLGQRSTRLGGSSAARACSGSAGKGLQRTHSVYSAALRSGGWRDLCS